MLKLGITGGIGSGKSLVCKIFSVLAVPVFKADEIAKAMLNHAALQEPIISRFGHGIMALDGKIDRRKLASLVFSNPESLSFLNSIIHPAVQNAFKEWCSGQIHEPYVIEEAAILFESGAWKELDKIITVTCPEEERIRRVIERDHCSRDEVVRRMQNQTGDTFRTEHSDFTILNDGNTLLIPQVIAIHERLIADAGKI
jgi:dephospho-CoA kinase